MAIVFDTRRGIYRGKRGELMSDHVFDKSPATTERKLRNFAKYIRRQTLARFLVQEHLFRLQLPVKGSIIECGVHEGGGLMAYSLEPRISSGGAGFR